MSKIEGSINLHMFRSTKHKILLVSGIQDLTNAVRRYLAYTLSVLNYCQFWNFVAVCR
jgi:hypothetical protein